MPVIEKTGKAVQMTDTYW